MNIREWPAEERPREKLLQRGAGSLTDTELLAVFLGSGVRGRNVVELSRGLLVKFGSLRRLLEADREAFVGELGLGPVRYSQLQALLEIGRRHLATSIERESAMDSPETVRRYLKAMLRHEASEVFGCLFLDTKHRPLAFEILFRGTIDRASVYPREVVRRALLHNAAALILRGYGIKRMLHPLSGSLRTHISRELHSSDCCTLAVAFLFDREGSGNLVLQLSGSRES